MTTVAGDPGDIAIVAFDDRYADAFARLNRDWLVRFDLLEEGDRKHLEHPRDSILSAGGEIFLAVSAGVVYGTCAVIPRDHETVELAKLAVAESARGRGLGKRLSLAAIQWARNRGSRCVVLVSSTKLTTALGLYERLGFEYADLPDDPGYASADVFMKLRL
ncbi:MAG: GNAT family N-acetyltransferase [Blastocatellia bacterium]|jgi:GNAT superfamily N-acetyltransferase|nr:GNAT family N-acetyltransferase [Blastocatellia bacterium]MBK6425797.1 GNAT family N-acetyltransferase [Blastocatellia bacterium]